MVTIPKDKAEEMAQKVVVSGLAACVNIVDNAKSIYKWEGELKTDTESILFIKTATKKVENLIKSVRKDHPYQIPEVISMTISEGNPDYLNWVDSMTKE